MGMRERAWFRGKFEKLSSLYTLRGKCLGSLKLLWGEIPPPHPIRPVCSTAYADIKKNDLAARKIEIQFAVFDLAYQL